jgi:hypothetical protein
MNPDEIIGLRDVSLPFNIPLNMYCMGIWVYGEYCVWLGKGARGSMGVNNNKGFGKIIWDVKME